ncbi:MAG: dTDP-glucose 4,6-dehydratase [Gemmatimonadales bacterium]|nr:dTDP-glucose 4,6-dehydratase [Gemmatimonadales bacterium]
MPRSVMVTGGAGFIGANFVYHWVGAHPADQITVIDALTYAGNRDNLAPVADHLSLTFVHGDICDSALVSRVIAERTVDTIVHFAAESHVDRSIVDPGLFLQTNIIGTQVLLAAARAAWRVEGGYRDGVRFHHVSTDEVYGSLAIDAPPAVETTRYEPNSPYAASKAAADHLVRAFHRTYGLPVTTSNCSNNYGPCQFPEKLIPLLLINALEGKSLPIYGDGMNIRDWLYVGDHCRAIEAVLERGRPGEVYNVGGDAPMTNLEVVRTLSRLIDEAFSAEPALAARFPSSPAARGGTTLSLLKFVTDRPGHDRRYDIDGSKIAAELGFRPAEGFESGLRQTVEWYLANEEWWRAVLDGSYREWVSQHYGDGGPAGQARPL